MSHRGNKQIRQPPQRLTNDSYNKTAEKTKHQKAVITRSVILLQDLSRRLGMLKMNGKVSNIQALNAVIKDLEELL